MNTAQELKDRLLKMGREQGITIEKAFREAETHIERTYIDYTEGKDDAVTRIYDFEDGSQLKIGEDGSIFIESEEEINYLSL